MKKIKEIKIINQDESTEIANIGADAQNVDYNNTTVKDELDKLNVTDNLVGVDLADLQSQVSGLAEGGPKGVYPTVAALTQADPDHSKIYIVTADGHWYYYNNGWKDGGIYQATKIEENSIYSYMANFIELKDEGNIFDKYNPNTIPYYINIQTKKIASGSSSNRSFMCQCNPNTMYLLSFKIPSCCLIGSAIEKPNYANADLDKAIQFKNDAGTIFTQTYWENSSRDLAFVSFTTEPSSNWLVLDLISPSNTNNENDLINSIRITKVPDINNVTNTFVRNKERILGFKEEDAFFPYSELTIAERTLNNAKIKIWIPSSYSSKGANCVIGFHGNGSGNDSWTNSTNYADRNLIRELCLSKGYIFAVAEYKNSRTTWGNKYAVNTYKELINFLKDNFKILNWGIFANSMGGIESLNTIRELKLQPSCFIGTSLTYNLKQIYDAGIFKNVIKTAYNISSDNEYEEKTLYKDPSKNNIGDFIFPVFVLGGTADDSINQNANGFYFYNDMNRFSLNNTLIQIENGTHNLDISNYMTQISDFLDTNM